MALSSGRFLWDVLGSKYVKALYHWSDRFEQRLVRLVRLTRTRNTKEKRGLDDGRLDVEFQGKNRAG